MRLKKSSFIFCNVDSIMKNEKPSNAQDSFAKEMWTRMTQKDLVRNYAEGLESVPTEKGPEGPVCPEQESNLHCLGITKF